MKKPSKEERERIERINNTALFNIGYEYSLNICDETDKLLENLDEIEFPDKLDDWFENFMAEEKKKEKKEARSQKLNRLFKRVAGIFVAFGVLTMALSMSVEAFRIRLFNVFSEVKEDGRFENIVYDELKTKEYELPDSWSGYYYLSALPIDYNYISCTDDSKRKMIFYSDSSGNEIIFYQVEAKGELQFDYETTDKQSVEINGVKGYLYTKNDKKLLSWFLDDKLLYLESKIDTSLLIKLAENTMKKK